MTAEGRRIVGIVRAPGHRRGGRGRHVGPAVYRAFDRRFSSKPATHPARPAAEDRPGAMSQHECPNGQCPLQTTAYLAAVSPEADRAGPWRAKSVALDPRNDRPRAGLQREARQADRIAGEGSRFASQSPPAAAAPDYWSANSRGDRQAKEASKKADEAKAAIKPAIDEALKPVHDDLTKLKPAIELADKVQARLEKLAELPGPLGKPAQKIEADLAAGNVDQALRDAAKTVGAVLLVLGLVAAVTLHLIGQHKGAIRVLADKLAAQNPSNTTLQTIAQKLDSVEDNIASKLPAMLTAALAAAAAGGVPGAAAATGAAAGESAPRPTRRPT